MSIKEQYTLLVVDDEPNIVKAIGRLFRGAPINLLTAASGEEALEVIASNQVHVLVTDNRMPGMSGIDLVQRVRERSPDTVRLIISGQSDMDAVLDAINEGEVFRFLTKPWNDIDLKITVNLALAHRRLQDDNRELRRQVDRLYSIIRLLEEKHPTLYRELSDHAETTAAVS